MTPPATAAARTGALPRSRSGAGRGLDARPVAPRLPRRVSGPARPQRARRTPVPAAPGSALGVRVVRGLGSLPDLRVLDRLISGRFWIALIAGSLIGIVGMQVWLLKLNTQIGQSMLRASNLQRDNASLQAEISQLSSGDRIEAQGTRLGLVMALSNGYRFLRVGSGDAARASHSIRPASAQTLVSLRAASRGTRRNAAATTTDTASPSPIASGSGSSSDATGTAAGVSATDSSTGQGR